MTTVVLHRLAGTKKALEICRLVESLYGAGRRTAIWVSDEGRAGLLDQFLWTYSTGSFVPHALSRGASEMVEPVAVATGSPHNPNGADVLVIADRLEDAAFAAGFAEVHDFLSAAPEDAGKREAWQAAPGFVIEERG